MTSEGQGRISTTFLLSLKLSCSTLFLILPSCPPWGRYYSHFTDKEIKAWKNEANGQIRVKARTAALKPIHLPQ